jgi:hypothetical protein
MLKCRYRGGAMGIFGRILAAYKKYKDTILSENKELLWVSEIEESVNYANNYNSDILLQYAKDNFTHTKESVEFIEKKANDLSNYLAVGTGLIGYLATVFPFHQPANRGRGYLIWGLACWVIAFFAAVATRYLSFYRYPENIRYMFEFMQKNGEHPNTLRTAMTISYEKVRISHLYRGKKKAFLLKLSYSFLIIAIFLILISILTILFSPVGY